MLRSQGRWEYLRSKIFDFLSSIKIQVTNTCLCVSLKKMNIQSTGGAFKKAEIEVINFGTPGT